MPTPRRLLILLLPLLAMVAACGNDDAATETAPDGSEKVVIDHAFGQTVIDAPPQRIVTLGTQWNGVLLALGAPVVGYANDGFTDGGLLPWDVELMPDDAEAIPTTDGVPYEQVAALNPDLIVVTHFVTDQAGFDALAAIAPTIPAKLDERQVDRWQDLTTVAGEVLDERAAAAAVIADFQTEMDDLAASLGGLEGKTYAFANYLPGDAIYVVADPTDGAAEFFGELGLAIAPSILDAADGVSGRATFSLEQAGLLDADVVLVLANGGDPHDLIGFDQLRGVATGAWAEVDYDLAVALNTPNAASLRWALDQIRPALETAAA